MATVATQGISAVPGPCLKPVIAKNGIKRTLENVKFNPEKHLNYTAPTKVTLMRDLGFAEDTGVSPVAVSQPFQLFSEDAVQQMRAEIFQPEVLLNCAFRSDIAECQLRGYSPKYAQFTYDAWNHPETLSIISKIAGVDLIPALNSDIGHINLSVKTEKQTRAELDTISKQKTFFDEDEGIAGCPWEDDRPVISWHHDSYPFVCVLMLSDCTNMVGGETALRTANGEVLKVRGPQMGCAVVLQGRYITHQALRAFGAQERITSVTSFRPRDPLVKDDTDLHTVRPITNTSELYYEFGEYRLEILEERIRVKLKRLREARRADKKCDTKALKEFLREQVAFLTHTDQEMVEEEKFTVGYLKNHTMFEDIIGSEDKSDMNPKRPRTK